MRKNKPKKHRKIQPTVADSVELSSSDRVTGNPTRRGAFGKSAGPFRPSAALNCSASNSSGANGFWLTGGSILDLSDIIFFPQAICAVARCFCKTPQIIGAPYLIPDVSMKIKLCEVSTRQKSSLFFLPDAETGISEKSGFSDKET